MKETIEGHVRLTDAGKPAWCKKKEKRGLVLTAVEGLRHPDHEQERPRQSVSVYLTSAVVMKGRSFQQPPELKQTRLNAIRCSQKY